MELYGRSGPVSAVTDTVSALADGRGGVVIVSGEPGIGKTALARTAVALAADRGLTVLEGRAFDHTIAVAYAPVVHALHRWVQRTEPATVQRLTAGLDQLGAMLPSLGTPPPLHDPVAARLLRFESTATLVERLTDDAGVLFVVDDLQWVDADTADLLRTVTRDLGQLPLVFLATVRDQAPTPHVARLLADLRRTGPTRELTLERLDRRAVAALAADHLGRAPAADELDQLWERSAGTPLFVEALARWIRAGRRGPVPEAGDVVDRLLDGATELQAEIATVLGLHRSPLDLTLLAGILVADEAGVETAADDLVARGLVDLPAPGQLQLRHPVLATALTDRLTDPARRHARIAERMRELHAPVEIRGRHVLGAGDLASGDEALDVLVEAGRRALGAGSSHEAAQLLGRGVQLARDARPAAVGQLLADLGVAWSMLNETDAAAAALHEAVELARPTRDAPLLHRCLRVLADVEWHRGRIRELVRLADEVLAELGPPDDDQVFTQLRLLGTHLRDWEMDAARARVGTIGRITADLDGPVAAGTALYSRIVDAIADPWSGGGLPVAADLTALRRTGALRDLPGLERRFVDMELDAYLAMGRLELLPELEDRTAELARILPTESRWRLPIARLVRRIRQGELDVDDELVELLGVEPDRGRRLPVAPAAVCLAELAWRRGDPELAGRAAGWLESAAARGPLGARLWAAARAQHSLLAGRPADAHALLDGLLVPHWTALGGPVGVLAGLEVAVAVDDGPSLARAADYLETLGGPGSALAARAALGRARFDRDAPAAGAAAECFARLGLHSDRQLADRVVAELAGSGHPEPVDGVGRAESGAAPGLTGRQLEVARLVATGLTNRQIAEELHLSIRTVTSHLDHVYTRLGISSRTRLAVWLREQGLDSGQRSR